MTRRVMSKLLHPILTGIKAAASGDIDGALSAAHMLFGGLLNSPTSRQHESRAS